MLTKEQLIYNLCKFFDFQEEDLKRFERHKLEEMYSSEMRRMLNNRIAAVKEQCMESGAHGIALSREKSLDEYWKDVQSAMGNTHVLYSIIEEIVMTLSMEDVENMLEKHASDDHYQAIYKKFRIKFRQYQEELVAEISDRFSFLPPEEHFNFMRKVETYRANIAKLRDIIHNIDDEKKLETTKRMSLIRKEILHDYYPQSYKHEYKEYFEEKVLRLELIDSVIACTNRYSKDQLMAKKMDELKQIEDYYTTAHQKEEDENKLIDKYKGELSKLLYEENEKQFHKVIGKMLIELKTHKILELIKWVQPQNDVAAERLYTTYLAHIATGSQGYNPDE